MDILLFYDRHRRHGGLRNTRNGTKSGENAAKRFEEAKAKKLLIIEVIKACDHCGSIFRDLRKALGVIVRFEDNQSQDRLIPRPKMIDNKSHGCSRLRITCDGLLNSIQGTVVRIQSGATV